MLVTKNTTNKSYKTRDKVNFSTSVNKILRDIGKGTYRSRFSSELKVRFRKSFPAYRLVRQGLCVFMKYRRYSFDNFNKHFGINKTNRVIGFTPDFVGATRANVVRAKNYIIEFVNDNIDEIKKVISSSCYNDLLRSVWSPRVVYSAGYDTVYDHLKEYLKDNVTEDIISRENILEVLSYSNYKWFRAPICDFNRGREIFDNVRINLDAYSGHYTTKLFGPTKGNSELVGRNVAYKIWKQSAHTPYKNLYLWSVLGREKDIKFDLLGNKPVDVGTRVILSCEIPITILLMWISQKFNYILGYSNWDRTYNIIGEFDATKAFKLKDKSFDYDFVLEADWTYYDSNIDTNFLEIAGAILCCGLPDNKLHTNLLYTFISSVVTKYIIIPPGIVVELNRAQPSGHPAGTLINCNVNLIYWALIGYKIYGVNYADYMHVEVYGDDTRAFFKNHPNLVKIDQFIAECGLKSDLVYSNFRSTKIELESEFDIDFLKRRFNTESINWNHKKMFDKWFYQSKNRNIHDQISVVHSFLASVPSDKDLIEISKIFHKWINSKYSSKLNRESKHVLDNIKLLVDGDTDRIKLFKFYLADRTYNKGYYEQLKLHSFSVSRPKYSWLNNSLRNTSNENKMLILYSFGYYYDDLANLNFDLFSKKHHPPPINDNEFDRLIYRMTRHYRGECFGLLRRIRSKFIR